MEVDGVGSVEVKVVGVGSLNVFGYGVPGVKFSSEMFKTVLHLKNEEKFFFFFFFFFF